MNLRMDYLKKLQAADERVTIFLINGVKLQGQIKEIEELMDEPVAFVLDRSGHSQLVMFAHVATVLPEEAPAARVDGNVL